MLMSSASSPLAATTMLRAQPMALMCMAIVPLGTPVVPDVKLIAQTSHSSMSALHRCFGAVAVEAGKRQRARRRLVTGDEHRLHAGQARAHRFQLAGPQLGRHHQQPGLDLVDLRGQALGGQAQVHRHGDRSQRHRGQVGDHVLRAAERQQPQAVALAQAMVAVQPRGHALHLLAHLAPRQALAAGVEDIGLAVRVARDVRRQQLRDVGRPIAPGPDLGALPGDAAARWAR